MTLDANRYLTSVTTQAGRVLGLEHDAFGLLTRITGPRGYYSTIDYDAEGRVMRAEDPAGGSSALSSMATEDGREIVQTSALGRVASFTVEDVSTGDLERAHTAWNGTTNESGFH